MPRPTRKSVAAWIGTTLLVLLVAYPLSYAPVVKWKRTGSDAYTIDGYHLPMYRPVDWLIDNTDLRNALFGWAWVWGVESDFATSHQFRRTVWEY